MSTRSYPGIAAALVLAGGLAGCAGQSIGAGVVPTAPNSIAPPPATLTQLEPAASKPESRTPEQIFTANRDNGSIVAFYAHDSGNVYPVESISGARTLLGEADSLAVDKAGNVYTANDSATSIEVFAAGADGNVKPKRIISGRKTKLGPIEGLLVDASGNLLVSSYWKDEITEYASGAHGDASPIATIQGSNTQLDSPEGMALDGQGRLYVANADTPSIVIFGPGANGNVSPLASIAGSNTGLSHPFAVAVDSKGRILVADQYAGVRIFNKGATGNVAPSQIITSVESPSGIAADADDHIYVADFEAKAIDEFAADAKGGATPLRTIEGSHTSLDGPNSIVLR